MNVKIGPYINHISTYSISEKLLGLFYKLEHHDERILTLSEWMDEKLPFIQKGCDWINSKRKREVEVHIDNYDVWSMDHTLALIILPMLKKLKDQKHGSPMVDLEDVPEHLRPSEGEMVIYTETGDTDDKFHARWEYVIGEMIWAFEQIVSDDSDTKFFDTSEWDDDASITDNFGRSKIDLEGLKAHNERIANGTRLFGRYFQGLWD